MLEPLPASFVAGRNAMHALAEHVLAPARYRVDGHIGLVPSTNGFGTPTFGDGERVRVEGIELVHERPGTSTRVGISTLGAAAQFVGVALGEPIDVYATRTPCAADLSIALDVDTARALAAWIAFGESVLVDLRETYAAHDPSSVTLWSEHFDLACDLGDKTAGTRGTYGSSPGDEFIEQPYLYVAPWDKGRRTGKFAQFQFGAAVTYEALVAATDTKGTGLDFLLECAALLVGQP